jgi:hypothetical protein
MGNAIKRIVPALSVVSIGFLSKVITRIVKARSLPPSGVSEGWFIRIGSSHTRKYWIKLEKLARHKQSSILQKIVNYKQKNYLVHKNDSAKVRVLSTVKVKFWNNLMVGSRVWGICSHRYKTLS